MLASLEKTSPEELLAGWPDGRIKLLLTQRLLRFRRVNADLFRRGSYLPLTVTGRFADCCVAFGREAEGKWIVVLVPRLSSRVGFPLVDERWKDTVIELPETLWLAQAHDLFTCRPFPLRDRKVKLADALSILPFAVITSL